MAAQIPRGPSPDEQVLAVLVTELASGRLPADVRDIFCSARLIGNPNKPSGTRPIAIGETLRRKLGREMSHQTVPGQRS